MLADLQPSEPRRRQVRDRDVVLAAVLVVALVLAVAWLTGLIPALDDAIGLAPVVIIGLILITVIVLVSTLLPRRRSG
jgi:fatty acid desaturase